MVEIDQFGWATMVVAVLGKHQKRAIACTVFGAPNRNSPQEKAHTLQCSFHTRILFLPLVLEKNINFVI